MSTDRESAVPGSVGKPPRIAVFSLSALGDLLLAVPVLAEVRRLYPGAHIGIVCERGGTAAFARDLGLGDEVVLLPPRSRRSPLALWRALSRVRRLGADIALQTLASHGAYGNLLLGATRASVRCGFEAGRFTNRLTHTVPIRPGAHYVTHNLDLLRRLGHSDVVDPSGRYLPAVEETGPPLAAFELKSGRFVVVSTGCDPRLFFKRWPDENWASLAQRLCQVGLQCAFVGDDAERARIECILATPGAEGVNLAGRTSLAGLARLVRDSAAVIGSDGMPLHLAASMRVPCVALFGPTDSREVGPWGEQHAIVKLGLPCSPCYGFHTVGKDIRCRTYECMRCLPVDTVFHRICDVVAGAAQPVA